ncbi:class II fumarate hydratase [Pseudonocardia broussonetiae]|uniref:Class II fumarate hydratase n=1 Tax=Pseudonocardia broussonetiae TaxID=2736640 RepID=A0A6M6JLT0_9PSEU|nr:class II fumarate hydratase [Pseudonocardia broussonetiae]QJY48898.1 class II fumarate hydratase [Pseudonocardia broussonetiae]
MGAGPTPRTEVDFGGRVAVPGDALWGAQTQRAIEAFTISDLRMPRPHIRALGSLKRAAARANADLGVLDALDAPVVDAIVAAAGEVADGLLDDHFRIDVFQTGSGTDTHMNANEVIANRANQLLGVPLGTRHPVHPHDHVNRGQSSNDVTPTVVHLTAQAAISHRLVPAFSHLASALRATAAATDDVVKPGRTHLQDAVPIRLGQEFSGHAGQVERSIVRFRSAQQGLAEVALGGTAVGTGLNTHPEFAGRVVAALAAEFDVELHETRNHFQAQNNLDAVVFASGALRTAATSLLKIADDVRWMSSGPRAGLGEIEVPGLSMGSSIMPGKTNPVVAEAVCQVAAKVAGNDATIALAGGRGNFELTVMSPVVAYCLLESIDLLAGAATVFADTCISGIRATAAGPAAVERSLMTVTALSPRIGYDAAAAVAAEARSTGRTIREVARERTGLGEDELLALLDPQRMVGPRVRPDRTRERS